MLVNSKTKQYILVYNTATWYFQRCEKHETLEVGTFARNLQCLYFSFLIIFVEFYEI